MPAPWPRCVRSQTTWPAPSPRRRRNEVVDRTQTQSPDGNAVALDEQLVKVADTETTHALVTTIYRTYLGMFNMALGRSSSRAGDQHGSRQGTEHLGERHGCETTRLRVIAENLANQDTTGSTPGAEPYRRKTMTFENRMDQQLGAETVRVKQIGHDGSALPLRYDPSNPAANAEATSSCRTSTASSR